MIDWNYMLSQIATVAFDILYFGAIIGTIVIIILDNRNPVKTMAWILILLFLPIVGLVFYFFFGRSQRRERIIGQKSYDRLLKKPMAEYLAQDCSDVPYEYSRLISFSSKRIKRFHLRGTVWQSIPKDIPNFNHCCVNCKKRSSISTWNITSLKMTLSGVWSGMC